MLCRTFDGPPLFANAERRNHPAQGLLNHFVAPAPVVFVMIQEKEEYEWDPNARADGRKRRAPNVALVPLGIAGC